MKTPRAPSPTRLSRALALFVLLSFGTVEAATHRGVIRGRVVDEGTGEPLPGVTVSVTSPALQGEQVEITEASGQYQLTELPPGDYLVRFYFADLVVERPDVLLRADQSLAVNVAIPVQRAKKEVIRIEEKAPSVDIGSAQLSTRVDDDVIRNLPVRGRTYDGVLGLAPGSLRDDLGPTFNGATSPENGFLVDGLDTTSPAFGLLGTRLSVEFLEETEVITGGYNAEYGRATGGVVNLVTKSGTSELRGSVWLAYQPLELEADVLARPGEAIATRQRRSSSAVDFGFELGGPLIQDRVTFYVGVAPSVVNDSYERIIRARTANALPAGQTEGTYAGDLAPDACAPWTKGQDAALCTTAGYATEAVEGSGRTLGSTAIDLSMIAKLDVRLSDDHHLSLEYFGNPSTFSGVYNNPSRPSSAGNLALAGFDTDPAQMPFSEHFIGHNAAAHLFSRFLDRRLRLDAIVGVHDETIEVKPQVADVPQAVEAREVPLAQFEDVAACQVRVVHGVTFDPCPVQSYTYGGFGYYNRQHVQRLSASAALTYLLEAAGLHALKLGADYQAYRYSNHSAYTGGGLLTIYDDQTIVRQGLGQLDASGAAVALAGGYTSDVTAQSQAFYLRDSYSPRFLPGATLNIGVRWELEQLQNQLGDTAFDLLGNVAPRIGVVYDWTKRGDARAYASWARYYEQVPLDVLDRQFSGSGTTWMVSSGCAKTARGAIDPASCTFPEITPNDVYGGTFGKVSPHLRGQYSDELVAGAEADVGLDVVAGLTFIHRDLGRVIEDISPDGGRTYFIANPGEAPDPGTVAELQGEIAALGARIAATTDPAEQAKLAAEKADRTSLLAAYQGQGTFPKPTRTYDALVLTAHKRFTRSFLLLASYTYSRTLGNYEGLRASNNKQLDPNVLSAFDLKDFLVNRDGPLPGDRPHNLKVLGAYAVPLDAETSAELTIGLGFNATSGRPIEVLGAAPYYGRWETFILPRGSGGRTPLVTSLDLHLAYARDVSKGYRVTLAADVFNVLNQQTATSVDEEYTIDTVLPIKSGTPADLARLTTVDGRRPTLNPGYGQPTAYQSPLALRFGARLTF